jgi:predicted amidohydrolase YtcJ
VGEHVIADKILIGNVIALDERATRAEAIAVADGKVLKIGSRGDVMQARGSGTEVLDLGSATIIPGFNDTHAHLAAVGLKTLRPSLEGARSIQDVLDRVRELAAKTPKGEWIVTMPVGEPPYYFNQPTSLAEKRMPTRQELDSVAPDHPVFLSSPGGYWGQTPAHSALSSLGLELNGIDRHSKPGASGIEIQHDASGEPNGVFIETNFVSLLDVDVLKAVPRFSAADRTEALRRAIRLCNAKGTTSVYEGHGLAPDVVASFRSLWERGELTMRSGLVMGAPWSGVEEAGRIMRDWLPFASGRGLGDAMLRISGIFIASDANLRIKDLLLRHLGNFGWGDYVRQMNSPEEFEQLCMLAGQHDLRVHTVISDRLHELVPVMERIAKTWPIGERRWVLEHVSKATRDDLERVAKLGVGVTLIPANYVYKGGHRFMGLSPEELDLVSPAKGLLELGAPVSAGTDAVPFDPLFAMWSLVTRRTRANNGVLGPGGRISNLDALRLITVCGAWLTFEEHVKGPLLPGYFADLAVMKRNPLDAQGDDILENECLGTMVGGRWVHGPGKV